MKKLTAASSML